MQWRDPDPQGQPRATVPLPCSAPLVPWEEPRAAPSPGAGGPVPALGASLEPLCSSVQPLGDRLPHHWRSSTLAKAVAVLGRECGPGVGAGHLGEGLGLQGPRP